VEGEEGGAWRTKRFRQPNSPIKKRATVKFRTQGKLSSMPPHHCRVGNQKRGEKGERQICVVWVSAKSKKRRARIGITTNIVKRKQGSEELQKRAGHPEPEKMPEGPGVAGGKKPRRLKSSDVVIFGHGVRESKTRRNGDTIKERGWNFWGTVGSG